MKRRILGYVAVVATVICLCAAPSFAADNFKIGVGYQGLVAGNYLNGLSGRGWFGVGNMAAGGEINVFYANAKVSPEGNTDLNANLWLVELKPMFAFLVRQNSRFYAGLKGGYGQYKADQSPNDVDGKFWELGGLVGAEWNFPSLPEVGFNFEVGYTYISNSTTPSGLNNDVDIKLHGINVGAGIKYYF